MDIPDALTIPAGLVWFEKNEEEGDKGPDLCFHQGMQLSYDGSSDKVSWKRYLSLLSLRTTREVLPYVLALY